jgi:hypothetical protein
VHGEVAAHCAGQLARDGKPQPASAAPLSAAALLERLEQGGYLRRRDADAAVDHLQQQRRGRAAGISCRRSSMPPNR